MSTVKLADTLSTKLARRPKSRPLPHRHIITEGWALGLAAFVVYLLLSVYFVFDLHYYAGDAVSRVANAYYVLFSQNPHLGAIGFIWNPLPSLLELPVVALHPWFPAVVTRGMAGGLVSAALGGAAVYSFHRILEGFGVPNPWRMALTLFFAFNPFIALYGANGMTDLMWVACILGTYSGVFDYLQTGSLRRLVSGGFWLAAGLGMRYEAVPFGLFVIIALVLGQWGRTSAAHWKGSALLLGGPIVFAGGVWMYFNWLIMKNPLYFLNSNYGNLAQTATGAYMTHASAMAEHSVIGSLFYVTYFGLLFWPIFLGFLVTLRYCFGQRRDARAIVLIAGTVGGVAMELALVYMGHLGQWDRYFISYIPDGILMVAFSVTKLVGNSKAKNMKSRMLWLLASVIVLAGDVGTVMAVQNPVLGQPNGQIIDMAWRGESMRNTGNNPFTNGLPLIRFVDAHPHMTILADTFIDWPVVVRAQHLNQFIITSDYDFSSILHNPRGRVTAILVPKPYEVAALDAVNRAWPGLWAGHVPWTRLIKSFPGGPDYRLYAVTSSAP